MIYARISIYQALKRPWKQSGMPELAVFKIVKKNVKANVHFVILFHFQGHNSRYNQ